MMTNTEFVAKLKDIATNYKTLYVMGCFGAPMTAANKKRYTQNHSYNKQASRTAMINAATSDTFGFDCVCLIKGVLWGWSGDKNKTYGGAGYACNGVPDIGADTMIGRCSGVSTNFDSLVPGEAVWMEGHIGVYIGDGLAVECTPKWANKVQITACNCSKSGYNRRNWTKHGKLPYITYVTTADKTETKTETTTAATTNFTVGDLVTMQKDAPVYGKTYKFSSWVYTKQLYVRAVNGSKITVSTLKTGAVTGTVDAKYLTKVNATSTATYKTHTVSKGDTLWNIALKYLGKGSRYTEIKTLNGLTSNTIYSGMVLKIPNK